nr:PHP domain-containing protein [Enterocloster clostridioformis]
MEKLMDLHMHSYYSDDGEFSPGELVRQCSMNGIRIMAIADHNSVRANEAGNRRH